MTAGGTGAQGRYAGVDVHYPARGGARAALVVASDPALATIVEERTADLADVEPYRPGAFFDRELPALRAVLQGVEPVDLLVVDGYVDLDPEGRPGLGAHVHAEVGVPVIGVAKTAFRGATHAVPVIRGASRKPLYVTAVGHPSTRRRRWSAGWPVTTASPMPCAGWTHWPADVRMSPATSPEPGAHDGSVIRPGAIRTAPSHRLVLGVTLVGVAVSVVHYVDNYLNYDAFPQPDAGPVPSRSLVGVSWFVFTAVAALAIWTHRRRADVPAAVCLAVYSLSGLIGLGHYTVPGATEMVWWRQAHVVADIVLGAALLVLAFAVWRSRGRRPASSPDQEGGSGMPAGRRGRL